MMIKENSGVEGDFADGVPTTDRGLTYGDGVFETVRVNTGRMTFAVRHWERLEASCVRLAIDFDRQQAQEAVECFLEGRASGVLKVIVTRGSGGRGYNPLGCRHRLVLSWHELPDYPESYWRDGIELFPCSLRLGAQPALAGMKHLNRLEQVLARAEWQDSRFAEGLLQDMTGHIIEGTMSNLFVVLSDTLCTPDLGLSGVAGVVRQWILDTLPAQGVRAQVQPITWSDMQRATEVFVCNSVNGVWPVKSCADMHWSLGEMTRRIQSSVSGVLHV